VHFTPAYFQAVTTATLPIFEAAVLVVAAPLCGVALAVRRLRGVVPAAALFAAALTASALWTIAALGWSAAGGRALVSHATVGTIGCALAALGAWFGSVWRDPLDAAAYSVGIALLATFGIFAAGPLAADLPTPVLNAALIASPIVSAASAADVDLLRTDLLYRISPLAHGRFDYPAWFAPLLMYGTLLLVSLAGTARALRKGQL
jgi:hypothetical protein